MIVTMPTMNLNPKTTTIITVVAVVAITTMLAAGPIVANHAFAYKHHKHSYHHKQHNCEQHSYHHKQHNCQAAFLPPQKSQTSPPLLPQVAKTKIIKTEVGK